MPPTTDFTVISRGGKLFLRRETPRAESWCAECLADLPCFDRTYLIPSIAAFAAIVNAIVEAGMIIEECRNLN